MNANQNSIRSLIEVGFTETEAEVYVRLLGDSPASGYRVAQAIGRPAPQVYRAIEALQRRGAVVVAEGKTRMCRAVPPDECLSAMERAFAARRERAEKALSRLPTPTVDERVYRIDSPDQAFEKCRSMLDSAERIVLIDVFPQPFAALHDDIRDLAERDVIAAIQVYEDTPLPDSALRVIAPDGTATVDRWLGQQLSVNIDGREFLSVLLSRDGHDVLHGFWSSNCFMAAMHYNGLSCEMCLADLRTAGDDDTPRVLEAWRPLFLTNSPAMNALERRTDEMESI